MAIEPTVNKSLEQLLEEKKQAEAVLQDIKNQIEQVQEETLVRCESCRLGWAICELTYYENRRWVHPVNSYDEGYWSKLTPTWKCSCGASNDITNPGIQSLKHLFMSVKNVEN